MVEIGHFVLSETLINVFFFWGLIIKDFLEKVYLILFFLFSLRYNKLLVISAVFLKLQLNIGR